MPAQSKAQHRLMEAAAHNPDVAKKVGIPQSTAKEFAASTPTTKGLPEHKGSGGKGKK
jgi:hypothetical protein